MNYFLRLSCVTFGFFVGVCWWMKIFFSLRFFFFLSFLFFFYFVPLTILLVIKIVLILVLLCEKESNYVNQAFHKKSMILFAWNVYLLYLFFISILCTDTNASYFHVFKFFFVKNFMLHSRADLDINIDVWREF